MNMIGFHDLNHRQNAVPILQFLVQNATSDIDVRRCCHCHDIQQCHCCWEIQVVVDLALVGAAIIATNNNAFPVDPPDGIHQSWRDDAGAHRGGVDHRGRLQPTQQVPFRIVIVTLRDAIVLDHGLPCRIQQHIDAVPKSDEWLACCCGGISGRMRRRVIIIVIVIFLVFLVRRSRNALISRIATLMKGVDLAAFGSRRHSRR
mmetsp:Transcript_20791/g.59306  ORF Transcript_20791/g.59306 Transcript_20791/m.59306 type:complete len:203 (+) Transcript_20791:585-1193(+)